MHSVLLDPSAHCLRKVPSSYHRLPPTKPMPLDYSAERKTARSLAFPLVPLPFPSRNGRCDTIVTGAASAVRCIELQALDLTAPQVALAGIVGQDMPSKVIRYLRIPCLSLQYTRSDMYAVIY